MLELSFGMNAFEAANRYISKASHIMNLGPRVERLLLSLEAEHHVTIPIERDNGELAVFRGYRFQHNSARGPRQRRPPLPSNVGRERRAGAGGAHDLEDGGG